MKVNRDNVNCHVQNKREENIKVINNDVGIKNVCFFPIGNFDMVI